MATTDGSSRYVGTTEGIETSLEGEEIRIEGRAMSEQGDTLLVIGPLPNPNLRLPLLGLSSPSLAFLPVFD